MPPYIHYSTREGRPPYIFFLINKSECVSVCMYVCSRLTL
jgi:hypothetical protein